MSPQASEGLPPRPDQTPPSAARSYPRTSATIWGDGGEGAGWGGSPSRPLSSPRLHVGTPSACRLRCPAAPPSTPLRSLPPRERGLPGSRTCRLLAGLPPGVPPGAALPASDLTMVSRATPRGPCCDRHLRQQHALCLRVCDSKPGFAFIFHPKKKKKVSPYYYG